MTADSRPEPDTPNPELESYFGEFITHSPEETFELARSLGERLTGGEIFLLSGELGAGKTVFAKGLAAGLGINPSDVTSPTFTLINAHEGRLPLFHVDLYRLASSVDRSLGLDELFDDEKAVTAIEWPERLITTIPARATTVKILGASGPERRIEISVNSDPKPL